MELEGTELSKAIQAVRDGLALAQQDGEGAGIRFSVKEVTLDFGIELRNTASTGGGVKAFVVSADARGERAQATTHRMTVTLEIAPNGDGRPLRIGDDTGRRMEPLPRQPS